jgi:hypothetical protein
MNPTTSDMAHHQAQFQFARELAQEREYAQVRERRHSALIAIMDPELLMMHSIAKNEVGLDILRLVLVAVIHCYLCGDILCVSAIWFIVSRPLWIEG